MRLCGCVAVLPGCVGMWLYYLAVLPDCVGMWLYWLCGHVAMRLCGCVTVSTACVGVLLCWLCWPRGPQARMLPTELEPELPKYTIDDPIRQPLHSDQIPDLDSDSDFNPRGSSSVPALAPPPEYSDRAVSP